MKLRSLFLFLITIYSTATRAQNNFTNVDTWLKDNAAEMGGRVVLVVYKDGKLIYNHAENNMNIKQKFVARLIARKQGKKAELDDFNSTSKIAIASCSKWLSAALVMTFVDEGKLKLTDTVGKYLPVLSQHGKGMITIGQCLSHQTGIKTPPLKESLEEMRQDNFMDDAMADIAALPMEGTPGKVFHYSNAGLQIAGAILEKISCKSFESLFIERIAQPLGMKNTDFGHAKVALPAGGAYSTPEDYLNFLTMIMNRGVYNGKRILSESSISQMQVNRITPDVKIAYSPAEAGGLGYGYGEWVFDAHTVSSPGLFGSFPWIDNDKHYAAFMLCFYIKSDGRQQRYKELKQLVDEAVK
ncbi:CubicO group peptidase (beta-lactamase class C family) [Mucilaginibacter oryzae]|uniref:CubicO group peptidase (Beta-lactamase class C family) n=1 Tax=Mucilaginibacter oryzae TaxID=468058 RepID=A0A316H060_9SPHI|nr:serine hydrolase domain-containing protein [Mucilaginibacter oryzae]PWK69960.1 CubicO group peptidase (beta-lactamase class C family) [Mucilaginibacter oryzae]